MAGAQDTVQQKITLAALKSGGVDIANSLMKNVMKSHML